MALVISNPETERLVEASARRRGRTPEETVADAIQALSNQSETTPFRSATPDRAAARAKIGEIQRRAATLPKFDARSADEIIGYDENGIPR